MLCLFLTSNHFLQISVYSLKSNLQYSNKISGYPWTIFQLSNIFCLSSFTCEPFFVHLPYSIFRICPTLFKINSRSLSLYPNITCIHRCKAPRVTLLLESRFDPPPFRSVEEIRGVYCMFSNYCSAKEPVFWRFRSWSMLII
jgi:hypothetical protein